MSETRSRSWPLLIVALLAAVLIGYLVWSWLPDHGTGGGGGGGGEGPVAEELGPLRPPNDLFARLLPSREVELFWDFDARREPEVSGFRVEVWDVAGERDLAIDPAPLQTRSLRIDGAPAAAASLEYYVAVLVPDGAPLYSDALPWTHPDLPDQPPPPPAAVRARWLAIHGRPVIAVEWEPPADTRRVYGYRVYTDNARRGVLWPAHDPDVPLAATELFFAARNREPRDISVQVATVDRLLWESEVAATTVAAPAAVGAAPANVRVARASEDPRPVTVTWDFPEDPTVVGFRVFEHDMQVADESVLDASARSWADSTLVEDWDYAYEVAAVFRGGLVSQRAAAPLFRAELTDEDLKPAPPSGFLAQWAMTPEGARVRLSWNPTLPQLDVARHVVEVSAGDGARFRAVAESVIGNELLYDPGNERGRIVFRVIAVDDEGRASDPAETEVPAAGDLLVPARLIDFRAVEQGAASRVTVLWRYPDVPTLIGFRLYQDGELIADEQSIDRTARSWTLPPISRPGRYALELEAVAVDGTASARGPTMYYDRNR